MVSTPTRLTAASSTGACTAGGSASVARPASTGTRPSPPATGQGLSGRGFFANASSCSGQVALARFDNVNCHISMIVLSWTAAKSITVDGISKTRLFVLP